MADLKPISQFATASSVEANTLLFVSTPNQNNGYDSEKVSASELGEALVNDFEYTQDLSTVSKKVTGAINEQQSVIGYSYDAYDPTTAYSKDDLCIYNNTLYKAKQTTTGNLPTNTTYWEPTSIADEINKLKDDITTASYWKTTQLTIANSVSVGAGVETQPVTISIPQYTGYTVLTFTEVRATGHHGAKVTVQAELANANELVYALYNPSNVNATVTVTVRVIYVKTIT